MFSKDLKYLLVSDLDDTIKISHTEKKLATVARGIFRSSAYAGMAALYREIICSAGANPAGKEYCFAIISSSPKILRNKINRFLSKHKFPAAFIILRNWLTEHKIADYKFTQLMRLQESQSLPFILVGDDTEHDPEIFQRFQEKFPNSVLAIYIHILRGRPLPAGQIGYYTAFDFACHELAAGRIDHHQIETIAQAMLAVKKSSRLIPAFGILPEKKFLPPLGIHKEKIIHLWLSIQSKFPSKK